MKIPNLFKLSPNRVWRTYPGGRVLDERQGLDNPKDTQYPEDWVASTTKAVNKGREGKKNEGLSVVSVGGERHLLRDLISEAPDEMVGEAHFQKYGAHTRFLLKFLDSAIRLHLQAHPTVAFSKKHLQADAGKTEAYVILAIRKEITDPYIMLGIQHPLPPDKFKEAIEKQDTESLLSCFDKIPIQAGDVFIVPGGMPHAIGEGVLMIEIMEPTDFAVRLEFERGDIVLPEEARFMGRDVSFAMDMISLQPKTVEQVRADHFCKPSSVERQDGGEEFALIGPAQTDCFSVHRIVVSNIYEKEHDGFYVGIVTSGKGKISMDDLTLDLIEGDRFFVTNAAKKVHYQGAMEVVLTFPPE
ncbi:MAG: mannose-6-phosphate isomerase [Saprospiraceae bacterium]|nr:mannose-6-phosphate isomerase [Saprospiraceae bacterium]